MSAKASFPCAVLLTLLTLGPAWCQAPPEYSDPAYPPMPATPETGRTPAAPGVPPAGAGPAQPMGQLSEWIRMEQPGCCGPVGGNGPITYELYFRTGPNLVLGGSGLAHTIETGWVVQGGGRSLFFNVPQDRAWTIDLSISNIWNHGNRPNLSYPFTFQQIINGTPTLQNTTLSTLAMNRTFINLAAGREWYLTGAANSHQFNWRAGTDFGGQLGTERLDTFDPSQTLSHYRRRNDVISGMFVALHTDVEIPCGQCYFLAGLRAEWGWTWSDIIPNIGSDVNNLNLLYTGGFRY